MSIPNTNEARIETSTACNAACVFCPWPTDDFTRKKEIMSLEDYKFYIDKLKDEMVDKIVYTYKFKDHSYQGSFSRSFNRSEISTCILSFLSSFSFFLDSRSLPVNFALGKASSDFLLSKDMRKASYFGRTLR